MITTVRSNAEMSLLFGNLCTQDIEGFHCVNDKNDNLLTNLENEQVMTISQAYVYVRNCLPAISASQMLKKQSDD